MIIRSAAERDRESIFRIHQESPRQLASSHYLPPQIESWIGSLTPAVYDFGNPARDFIVAESEGALLGFGCLDSANSEIIGVFVAPDAAGAGVGGAILGRLEQLAAERGLGDVSLHATLNARVFYERAGYELVENTIYRSRGGLELPVIAMSKRLA